MSSIDKIFSFTSLVSITSLIIINDKEKYKRFIKLLTSRMFSVNIIIVAIFSYYMLKDDEGEEGKRRKEATKQALLGLLIAFMAHIEMKIAPFWLIWISSYYLNA